MSKRILPGHVRAHTLWVCLLLMFVAWLATGSQIAVLGALLLVTGLFLGDNATHLHQENHRGVRVTWIESQQQKYRWQFVFIGISLAVAGFLLIINH